jgi:hypothetical protein
MKTELIKGNWDDFTKLLCQLKEEHKSMELLLNDGGDLWNLTTKTMSRGVDVLLDYDREGIHIDELGLDRFEILVSYYCAEDIAQEICEWKIRDLAGISPPNGRLNRHPMEDIEHRYTFELIK